MQPTKANKQRRKGKIDRIQDSADKGKHRDSSSTGESRSRSRSALKNAVTGKSRSSSGKEDKDQLIDLVIEDQDAEEVERVRARKEGSPEWNKHNPKHFVRTFPESDEEEVVREGHEPTGEHNKEPDQSHAVGPDFPDGTKNKNDDEPPEAVTWKERDYNEVESSSASRPRYHYTDEEPNVWDSPKR